jgi:hypothetical protein
MNRKIITIGIIALLIGTIITPTINAHTPLTTIAQTTETEYIHSKKNGGCLVFGFGICWGISPNIQRKKISIKIGRIQDDLYLWNRRGFHPLLPSPSYELWIQNIETGKIQSRYDLPERIFLPQFRGYGYIFDRYISKGPCWARFTIIGVASNWEEWNYIPT